MSTIPRQVRALYEHSGPFATVHLDGTQTGPTGADEVSLRWRAATEQLAAHGADAATVEAMAAAVAGSTVSGRHGRFLVAAGGDVLLDDWTATPPAQTVARWAPLPHVLPYLVGHDSGGYVAAVVDRSGADLFGPTGTGQPIEHGGHESVTGPQQFPLHRAKRGNLSQDHFDRYVEDNAEKNVEAVAHEIGRLVRSTASDLVIVAGEVRARDELVTALGRTLPQNVTVDPVEAGARSAGSSHELDAAIDDAVLRRRWRERRDVLRALQQGVGRGDTGVTGLDPVVAALQAAQAETVVISDDPSSTWTAWFGPDPVTIARTSEDLSALGVENPQQDRFDAVLARAVACSDAALVITPDAHDYLTDGLGAVLRYAVTASADGS